MANRDDIIRKIKSLRAKADDAGATEAEAMQAAEMAARLLVRHDISPDELRDVEKTGATSGGFRQGKTLHPVLHACHRGLGEFTETTVYNDKGELRFIGIESDVLMATYLSEMFVAAAKRLWREFYPEVADAPFAVQTHARESLFSGFGHRLSQRMLELAEFRVNSREASHGTALVVVKEQIIARHMEEIGLKLVRKRARRRNFNPQAFNAGATAANDVNLGRPFGSDGDRGVLQ